MPQPQAKDYWNRNLDTDNLSRRGGSRPSSLADALELAATPEFRWLAKRMEKNPQEAWIMDLGGGVGVHSILWARMGAHVVVVDLAVDRLRELRRLASRAGVADRVYLNGGKPAPCP